LTDLHSWLVTAAELEHLRFLEGRVAKAEVERDEYRKLVLLLQEQNEKLKRGLLSQKAERLPKNDAQLSLSILQLALGDAATVEPPVEEPSNDEEQTIAFCPFLFCSIHALAIAASRRAWSFSIVGSFN
jgi:hypothetical protein